MKISNFLSQINSSPESIVFQNTMDCIEENYVFTPTAFKNGDTYNLTGKNSGSCKLFFFAKLNNLDIEQTLACFGQYYFKDVLNNLEGTDHQNIRNFMKHGWDGIQFEGVALVAK